MKGRFIHIPTVDLQKMCRCFRQRVIAFFLWRKLLNERLARNTKVFPAVEFLFELLQHVPDSRRRLVRTYGLYSSRARGTWYRQPCLGSLDQENLRNGPSVLPSMSQAHEGHRRNHRPRPSPQDPAAPHQERHPTSRSGSHICHRTRGYRPRPATVRPRSRLSPRDVPRALPLTPGYVPHKPRVLAGKKKKL